MFTGLVEGQGEVVRIENKGDHSLLSIKATFAWEEKKIGESIAVNGICLTAANWKGDVFSVDVSQETLKRSDLGGLKIGDRVNLERALRLSDRLGGHLVSGHIDGTGKIIEKELQQGFYRLKISFNVSLRPFIVDKGSIALDGVSLTINEVGETEMGLTLIPHTAAETTLVRKKIGEEVNLETDLIGKYVYQFLSRKDQRSDPPSKVDEGFLRKHGFI
jgi:riboflavin synthase